MKGIKIKSLERIPRNIGSRIFGISFLNPENDIPYSLTNLSAIWQLE